MENDCLESNGFEMILLDSDKELLNIASNDKVLFYGAGLAGTAAVKYLADNHLINNLFAVAVTNNEDSDIMGVPVLSFESIKLAENINSFVIVITTFPNLHNEIAMQLKRHGITKCYALSRNGYLSIRRTIHDFSIETFLNLKSINNMLNKFNYSMTTVSNLPEIIATHTKSFSEYENIFRGKDVVILCTGPSLNRYKPIEGAIHIGVNRAYRFDKVKLDFLFAQDFNKMAQSKIYGQDEREKYLEDLSKLDCTKFIGFFPGFGDGNAINLSTEEFERVNGRPFYMTGHTHFSKNICYHPLPNSWSSVVFQALNFAFFTRPSRIFIVGADGYSNEKNNYFIDANIVNLGELGRFIHAKPNIPIKQGWLEAKKFAEATYSDLEIISINPKLLKGIFSEIEY